MILATKQRLPLGDKVTSGLGGQSGRAARFSLPSSIVRLVYPFITQTRARLGDEFR